MVPTTNVEKPSWRANTGIKGCTHPVPEDLKKREEKWHTSVRPWEKWICQSWAHFTTLNLRNAMLFKISHMWPLLSHI